MNKKFVNLWSFFEEKVSKFVIQKLKNGLK